MRRINPSTLKPCPFCGKDKPIVLHRINANTVTCRKCGAQVKQSGMGLGDAAWRWNRRSAKGFNRPKKPNGFGRGAAPMGLHVVVIEDRSCEEPLRVWGPFKTREDAANRRCAWAYKNGFDPIYLQAERDASLIESNHWHAYVLPLEAASMLLPESTQ